MVAREDIRERAQGDLDELLSQLAMVAKALLIRNGEFYPFGATIGTRGKFALVTPVPEGDRPTAHDVLDAVLADVRGVASTVRACGLVAMATSEAGGDAVRIELEHASGSALVIALPYARGEFGAFAYGDMEAHRIAPRIWIEPEPPAKAPRKAAAKPAPKHVDQPALFDLPEVSAPPVPEKPVAKPKGAKRADAAPHRTGSGAAKRPALEAARPVRASRGTLRTQPA